MDVRRFFLAARKRWWVVLVVTLVGVIAAVGITSREAKQYRSSVTFFVATPAKPADAYQANLYAQQLVNSYVKLLGSDELARRVIAHARLHESTQAVAGKISGTADLNTVLLTARAVDSTPAGAHRLTSAIAAVFGKMVGSLTNDPTASRPSVVLSVVSGPTNPISVAPQRKLNYLLGMLSGLVVGLAVAALRELLDTSIRSDEQLGAAGIRALGSISRIRRSGSPPLIVGDLDRSILAEEMRLLRTTVQRLHVDRPVQVIAVVSPGAGDGKSTVAINLALAFAEAGRRTLLVDADLRGPCIAEYLGLEGRPGLSDVLACQADIDTVLRTWGESDLQVLPSGSLPVHPAELLGSRQMAGLVGQLRGDFDTIVVDTPSLWPVIDGAVAALLADGAIVVLRNGKTRRAELEHARQVLLSVDAPLLGAVRNMVRIGRREMGTDGRLTWGHRRAAEADAERIRWWKRSGQRDAEPGVLGGRVDGAPHGGDRLTDRVPASNDRAKAADPVRAPSPRGSTQRD